MVHCQDKAMENVIFAILFKVVKDLFQLQYY